MMPPVSASRRWLVRPIRRLLWWLLCWLPLVGLLALLLAASPAINDTPLVDHHRVIDGAAAGRASRLARRIRRQAFSRSNDVSLRISGQELNSLLALASRALPSLKGRAEINHDGIDYAFSWRLPDNPLGQYLSFSGSIPTSAEGLVIGPLQIGYLRLPGGLLDWLLKQSLDIVLGDRQGSQLLTSIHGLSTANNTAVLYTRSADDLPARLQRIGDRIKRFSADANLFANSEDMRHYFRLLVRQQQHYPRGARVSLANMLQPLFSEAARRSGNTGAVQQNQAAILALGVYLGSYHFEKLIGNISPPGYKAHRMPIRVHLAERQDLRLHFIFSAVLRVLADQGVSLALGEFKELRDSQTGGSGFSFVDLAADRAGARFADLATASEASARRLQQQAAAVTDAGLLPAIDGLPEGLSQRSFEQRFGNVESSAYLQLEREIDRRLQQLPLYQTPQ